MEVSTQPSTKGKTMKTELLQPAATIAAEYIRVRLSVVSLTEELIRDSFVQAYRALESAAEQIAHGDAKNSPPL